MNSPPNFHTFSDIFYSSEEDTSRPSSPPLTRPTKNPDTTRLQTTHHTAGYRDGISNSKTSFLQRGFDEGYALGAELGVRVGYILGILEGLRALPPPPPAGAVAAGNGSPMMKKGLGEARRELVVERVFAREWWGEDGVWRFEVGGGGEEEEVTFARVAEGHPLLKRWVERVRAEMGRAGVREGGFEGEEWERGRVGEREEGD